MNKLSKKSQTLVDDFGKSSEYHGWQEDQGVGREVDRARKNCEESKKLLERHVARLEAQVKRYKPSKLTPRLVGDEHSHANWETAGGTTEEQNEARFSR